MYYNIIDQTLNEIKKKVSTSNNYFSEVLQINAPVFHYVIYNSVTHRGHFLHDKYFFEQAHFKYI